MPKKTIKRLMPDPQKIKEHKHLRYLGSRLHDASLWHLNRRSASGAFAVGLFFAWMPVPMQMLLAALFAVYFRVNLPLSVVLVWISNPITMPPMFYGAYLLGTSLIGAQKQKFSFEISIQWLIDSISTIGPPFLLGCLIFGLLSSIVGYGTIRLLWRLSVLKELKQRKMRRSRRR